MCMGFLHVCELCVCSAYGGQNWASDPLSCHVGNGN